MSGMVNKQLQTSARIPCSLTTLNSEMSRREIWLFGRATSSTNHAALTIRLKMQTLKTDSKINM